MKLDTVDDRKPATVTTKLEAPIYDLVLRYKEYAATKFLKLDRLAGVAA
jgi:hypothetical protein